MPVSESGGTRRVLLMSAGWALVALGAAGVVLPLMPATPFFLLAAWCFARSSPKFHDWLLGHRVFGALILAYRERRGMTARQKAATIIALWLALIVSGWIVPSLWIRLTLGAVGLGVSVHILRMRTRRHEVAAALQADSLPD